MILLYIIAGIIFVYFGYKLFLEKRYYYLTFSNGFKDAEGKRCTQLVYIDRQATDFQIKLFYDVSLSHDTAEAFIENLNKQHRANCLASLFPKGH